MIVKESFNLLKFKNILNLPKDKVDSYLIENGERKIFAILEMMKSKVGNHFTKNRVYDLISDLKKRKIIQAVYMPDYPLSVSYNPPTDGIIINVNDFNTDDITSVNPDPKNIYACLVYGITFRDLVTQRIQMKTEYFAPITNYILSLMIQMFGKEYGLLGIYSNEISKLKFLIGCYVNISFFGIEKEKAYKLSSSLSAYDYKNDIEKLNRYDFNSLESLILSLSDFRAMSGLDRYSFTSKFIKILSIKFLPALEDLSRFISIITTSNIGGSNVVPTFIHKYNESEFEKILAISKVVFRKPN